MYLIFSGVCRFIFTLYVVSISSMSFPRFDLSKWISWMIQRYWSVPHLSQLNVFILLRFIESNKGWWSSETLITKWCDTWADNYRETAQIITNYHRRDHRPSIALLLAGTCEVIITELITLITLITFDYRNSPIRLPRETKLSSRAVWYCKLIYWLSYTPCYRNCHKIILNSTIIITINIEQIVIITKPTTSQDHNQYIRTFLAAATRILCLSNLIRVMAVAKIHLDAESYVL